MTDYISRETLLKRRNEWLCTGIKCGECPFSGYGAHPDCELSERIDRVPAADVAPVRHGTWLPIVEANEDGSPYQTGVFCSECGHCDCVETNYCPECGAKMDGGKKNAE